jgi:hypothetical protein
MIEKCHVCGKEKKIHPCHLKYSKSGFIFCSSHCFGIFNMTGRKYTKERNQKVSCGKLNEKNPQWKGDKVGKISLHMWINARKTKPKFCEECQTKPPKDLANISGKYKRDITDYKWLCRKCHEIMDGHITNLKQFKEGYYE